MRVLALEPYHGGSHRAFLDGWQTNSRHRWTTLDLPAHHWKWRMRHAASTLADRANEARAAGDGPWDVLLASDMLNLAEFLGLAPEAVRTQPAVIYFHENQLTYPVRREDPRDVHFGLTNALSALAARRVWFNTAWHRESFLSALAELLGRMPDAHLADAPRRIAERSEVFGPGIDPPPQRSSPRPTGAPLRVCWAARWEHDKAPETFFAAIDRLAESGLDFRLSVIGEQFRDRPEAFDRARADHAGRIDRWGYQPTREAYRDALAEADVVVSTARHEFFGISIVEAVAAGAYPVLPTRLAYPELFGPPEDPDRAGFFYDGTAEGLTARLAELAEEIRAGSLWRPGQPGPADLTSRFCWPSLAPQLDDALESAAG